MSCGEGDRPEKPFECSSTQSRSTPALHRPRSTIPTTSPTRRDWVGWIDKSGSECGGAENRPADHQRVEHEAEREIKDDADYHGRDVVLQSVLGNRRPPRIAAVFEG